MEFDPGAIQNDVVHQALVLEPLDLAQAPLSIVVDFDRVTGFGRLAPELPSVSTGDFLFLVGHRRCLVEGDFPWSARGNQNNRCDREPFLSHSGIPGKQPPRW